jgi:glutathione reductase (NADPH)
LKDVRIEYASIATVVFSHPPIGTIGFTEPDAKKEFGEANVKVKQARFPSMLYCFNGDEGKVKTGLKLVLAGPKERVVGLHCIGPFSDEMLQGFAVAVRMGACRADFEASVAIHPTISEEFVTFGGWGQDEDADGVATPYMPPYLKAKATDAVAETGGFCMKSALLGGLAVAVLFGLRSRM